MTDHWHELRRFTEARIAQGRAGHGVRTATHLEFQLAHAQARDAVHTPWDVEAFAKATRKLGLEALTLATPVTDRVEYLKRPDLGRTLDAESRQQLLNVANSVTDVALIFSNGLSSTAMDAHGLALLQSLVAAFRAEPESIQIAGRSATVARPAFTLGPVCMVPNARVALSDEIGALLNARLAVIVIGERPGLTAADSLGIYMTYNPNPANTDAERNCISNVRPPAGLSYREAAAKLVYLARQAMQLGFSGTDLKDDMPQALNLNADPVGLEYPGIHAIFNPQKLTLNR